MRNRLEIQDDDDDVDVVDYYYYDDDDDGYRTEKTSKWKQESVGKRAAQSWAVPATRRHPHKTGANNIFHNERSTDENRDDL